MIKISKNEIERVKALGFLIDKSNPNRFNGRITKKELLTPNELEAIKDAASIYGSGEYIFTDHNEIEIPGIEFQNIENIKAYLKNYNIEFGIN